MKSVRYRGDGWPGHLTIEFKTGEMRRIPKSTYYDIRFGSFVPRNCAFCIDHSNVFSDISFGDAWLPTLKDDALGTSIIVSRTSRSDKILQRLSDEKIVQLDQISSKEIEKSQSFFARKRFELSARCNLSKVIGLKPIYRQYYLAANYGLFSSDL